MAYRTGTTATSQTGPDDKISSKWVNVTWMPHASLSQTSHVCLYIRSAQIIGPRSSGPIKPEDWQVRITVHGIAGLSLVVAESVTPMAPVESSIENVASNEEARYMSTKSMSHREWKPRVCNSTLKCSWDFIAQIPIRWRDLPRDAYFLFEVTEKCDVMKYRATLPLFDYFGRLQTGLKRLDLRQPSLSLRDAPRNPGLLPPPKQDIASDWEDDDRVWKASRILDQLDRFEESKLDSLPTTGTFRAFGDIPSVPWLDSLCREQCLEILGDARKDQVEGDIPSLISQYSNPGYLIVELPTFDVPIMHEETFYPDPQDGATGSIQPFDLALYHKTNTDSFHPLQLVPFLDYENENDNPVEDKYRTLTHDLLRGLVDPALKPDRVQRDRLAAIIASPSHHPTREEKDILWRFRFSLVDNRRALTKFLLAVDWTVESEVVQAAELLEQWRKRSPIEVTDALKLLGKQVAYQTNLVRAYAIDTLAAAPDDELRLYLLQLVQALKFENIQETKLSQANSPSGAVSSLASFLIGRAAASNNLHLANYLYWYLKVELADPTHGARYREVFAELQRRLSQTPYRMPTLPESTSLLDSSESQMPNMDTEKDSRGSSFKSIVDSVSKLGSSLRGNDQPTPHSETHIRTVPRSVWDVLADQDLFISGVMDIQMRSRDSRGKKDAKEANLKSLLSKEGYDMNSRREPVPLPSAPEILVNGVNPQSAKIFKSALYPALIEFHVEGESDPSITKAPSSNKRQGSSRGSVIDSSYKVIVKTGDDLRQDQLIIMMIKLMDGLLKRASLDLCLTPYSIIATSPTSGLVEFVDGSTPVSQILANNNNSILQFFQSCAPQQGSKYNVRSEVISSYVRSCAGYCVITYLLGVGDRHLDNILISKAGRLVHIDFGYIFGRDPKPLPPAFRLTREMVEGMGGLESTEYRQFCSLACQAFNALRKSAGLVLNLLHLMSDAGIEDLSNNPSADPEGVIAKVEQRFRLELTDEQAERYFLGLINDCLTAIAPRLMDVFHSIAVARR